MIKKSTFPSTITVVISFSLTWSVAGSNIIMHVTSQPANRLFTSWPCLNPSQSGKNYWKALLDSSNTQGETWQVRRARDPLARNSRAHTIFPHAPVERIGIWGWVWSCRDHAISSKMEQRRKLPGESVGKTRFVSLFLFFFIWLLLLSVWSLFISL